MTRWMMSIFKYTIFFDFFHRIFRIKNLFMQTFSHNVFVYPPNNVWHRLICDLNKFWYAFILSSENFLSFSVRISISFELFWTKKRMDACQNWTCSHLKYSTKWFQTKQHQSAKFNLTYSQQMRRKWK